MVGQDVTGEPFVYEHFDNHIRTPSKLEAFEIGFLQLTDQKGIPRDVQRDLVKFINKNLLDQISPEACMKG